MSLCFRFRIEQRLLFLYDFLTYLLYILNLEEADIRQLLDIARAAALDAGKVIMEVYLSGKFEASKKADDSPLTLADSAAHRVIQKHLVPTGFPVLSEEGSHAPFETRQTWDWYWLVDPLDGTKEFLKQNGEFTVNIALMRQRMPVGGVIYAPSLDMLYYGSTATGAYKEENGSLKSLTPLPEKTTFKELLQQKEVNVIASRSHLTPETVKFTKQFKQVHFVSMGSSLKLMLLAENEADIYPRFAPTMEWDTAAAHAILLALGKNIYKTNLKTSLEYNKPDLLNPSFVAF